MRWAKAALFVTVFCSSIMSSNSAVRAADENPFPKRIKVDNLDGGKEWLNTSGEITLADLRGKFVLLDFWTYCCINCMHILPDLKFLEQKYPNELVVIGVHSAKFDNEKDSANIRQSDLRYKIEHPVINDANMGIWDKFRRRHVADVRLLIDPEGNCVVGRQRRRSSSPAARRGHCEV